MKAQLLLETYSDSSISNAFTQLSRKYGALVSYSKEVMHQLEQHFQEHQQQQCMYSECIELIDVSRERLNDCSRPSSSIDEINAKLSSLKALSNSMEQAQNKIRYTMELTDKVIANTDSDGLSSIKEDADNLKSDFEVLLKDIAAVQASLAERLAVVGEFNKVLRQFKIWLEEIESEIEAAGKQELNSLIEKKSVLEKYSTILKDLESHDAIAKRLKNDSIEHPTVQEEIEECLQKYNNFLIIAQTCTSQLLSEIEEIEKYKSAFAKAETWLRETKLKLNSIRYISDSKATIEAKISEFNKLTATVPEGDDLVKHCCELGNNVGHNFGYIGRDRVTAECDALNSELQSIHSSIKGIDLNLNRCLDAWTEFENSKEELETWLNAIQNKVKPYLDNSDEISDTERLKKLKELNQDVLDHKLDVEALKNVCENLVEISGFTPARDQAVSMSGSYTTLASNLQELISKLEKYICNQGEFNGHCNEFSTWYNEHKKILDENSGYSGNYEILEQRLEKVKHLSSSLPEAQRLLDIALESGSKVLTVLTDSEKMPIIQGMESLKEKFSEFTNQISDVTGALSSILSRLQDFAQNKQKFIEWLDTVIQKIPPKFESKGDIVEIRTKIENSKHVINDMDHHKLQLKELQDEANELSLKTGDNCEIKNVDEIASKFNDALKKYQSLLARLEKELSSLQAYNHALQEIEKWLLQMSFHLMSHHSLQISNLIKTKEQCTKHQALVKEIQSYQKVIDSLKSKGNSLVNEYKDQAPKMETQIKQQMDNVQESYDSLLMTAENIQAQLEDALAKFKAYEDSLLMCEKLISETKPFIASGLDSSKFKSHEAKDKLDATKNILKKLINGREKLQEAIQGCIEATSSISRPSSPDVGFASSLPEKEMQIRIQLQDYIEQLQAFANALELTVKEWKSISVLRENIEKWIDEKEKFLTAMETKQIVFSVDAMNCRLHELEEVKIQITEKESDIEKIAKKEKQSNEPPSADRLQKKLSQLDNHVKQLINTCISHKLSIEEMNVLFNEIELHIKSSDEKIDTIEKQVNASASQKKQLLLQCSEELKPIDMLITKLKNMADKLNDILQEGSQLENQAKIISLEKRLEELRNRCLRKIQSIELLQTNISAASLELTSISEWINEKKSQLSTLPKPGYQSHNIENTLQEIKSLQRESLNKEIVIQSVEKKAENLIVEIDQREADSLRQEMKTVRTKYNELCQLLDSSLEKMNSFLEKSRHFEKELSDVRQWLIEKDQYLNRIEWVLSKVENLQNTKSLFVTEENIMKKFEETTLSEMYRHGEDLEELCTIEEHRLLNSVTEDIKKQVIHIKKLLAQKIEEADKLIAERKILEELLDIMSSWISKAEMITGSELRLDASYEVLEEQKSSYQSLIDESKKFSEETKKIQDISESIMKKMKSADKIQLQSDIKNLREKQRRIEELLRERLQLLYDALSQLMEQKKLLEESKSRLEEIKEEIVHLSQPVGCAIADAECLREKYEKVLFNLQEYRERLMETKPLSNLVDQFGSLLTEYAETIQLAQDKYAKAKQSCALREQYYSLITEISETISTCNANVSRVNEETISADSKLQKYQSILEDVIECEAKLTIASDKGEQIAKEGTATDCNKIMEELQKLRNKLNELKKTLNGLKTEHENMIASQKKLMHDIESVLEKLRNGISVMQSQPLLTLSSDEVQKEISKHKVCNYFFTCVLCVFCNEIILF